MKNFTDNDIGTNIAPVILIPESKNYELFKDAGNTYNKEFTLNDKKYRMVGNFLHSSIGYNRDYGNKTILGLEKDNDTFYIYEIV